MILHVTFVAYFRGRPKKQCFKTVAFPLEFATCPSCFGEHELIVRSVRPIFVQAIVTLHLEFSSYSAHYQCTIKFANENLPSYIVHLKEHFYYKYPSPNYIEVVSIESLKSRHGSFIVSCRGNTFAWIFYLFNPSLK